MSPKTQTVGVKAAFENFRLSCSLVDNKIMIPRLNSSNPATLRVYDPLNQFMAMGKSMASQTGTRMEGKGIRYLKGQTMTTEPSVMAVFQVKTVKHW